MLQIMYIIMCTYFTMKTFKLVDSTNSLKMYNVNILCHLHVVHILCKEKL